MSDFSTLGPVAKRSRELFPSLDTNIYEDDRLEKAIDISFVFIMDTENRRCLSTFNTVEDVEDFRNRVCLLSEKSSEIQTLRDILTNIEGLSETDD